MKSQQPEPNSSSTFSVRLVLQSATKGGCSTFNVLLTLLLLSTIVGAGAGVREDTAHPAPAKTSIPWSQLGAKAGAEYQGLPRERAHTTSSAGVQVSNLSRGEGLAVSATPEGARLRCVFQRLEGEAMREGLWLTSTVPNAGNDRLRVVAVEVGRVTAAWRSVGFQTCRIADFPIGSSSEVATFAGLETCDTADLEVCATRLPAGGQVSVEGQLVCFTRLGLVEEYTVSLDGVRQDFIIEQPPLNPRLSAVPLRRTGQPSTLNHHDLAVRLAVSGASVEPAASGARPVRYPEQVGEAERGRSLSHGERLVLENSGRKIAYSRLRVTNATSTELPARIKVASESDVAASRQSAADVETEDGGALPSRRYAWLAVVVNDAEAVYPVRIDPTFSEADWSGMNPRISGDAGWLISYFWRTNFWARLPMMSPA